LRQKKRRSEHGRGGVAALWFDERGLGIYALCGQLFRHNESKGFASYDDGLCKVRPRKPLGRSLKQAVFAHKWRELFRVGFS
jgi:hypothetical protein